MRRFFLFATLILLASLSAHAGHTPPKVFLRVHVQSAGEGQSSMEVMTIPIPPDGEMIQIRSIPEVSEIQLINADQDASGTLHLYFNHVGKVNLGAVTAQNDGRILVVILNGQVIYAPLIDQQINSGELDIPKIFIKPEVLQALQDTAAKNVRQQKKL